MGEVILSSGPGAGDGIEELRMAKNNYFRSGKGEKATIVFFDDESKVDTRRAWEIVRGSMGGDPARHVHVFRPTKCVGDWDAVPLIGHRSAEAIRRGIESENEKYLELREIREAFERRGRRVAWESEEQEPKQASNQNSDPP